ncbi:hypothetical protein CP08DC60_0422A, partial [Chlamydia psittaci 08DC60]
MFNLRGGIFIGYFLRDLTAASLNFWITF